MLLQQCSDSELLVHWQQGNQQAFDLLFERHFNKLLQFCRKYLAERELAEELVMDVMLRLWQRRDHLSAEASLSAYLFQSVKNAVIDQLRKRSLKTLSVEDVHTGRLITPSVEDHYCAAQLQQAYQESLTRLSPKRKVVFELSRHEGKSYKEISVETGVSISTVKQHMTSSLSTIRELMKTHTDIALLIIFVFLS